MPAGRPVRGRHGCSLAAMAAVGIRLGSADEGSPAKELAGVACRLHSGRAGSPVAPPACPLARSCEGGGRDVAWQRG
jgi:hypothetical protein